MKSNSALNLQKLPRAEGLFIIAGYLVLAGFSLVLVALVAAIFVDGISRLNWEFLTGLPSRFPSEAGVLAAVAGSFALSVLVLLISFPVGVGAAIYLEEYCADRFGQSRFFWLVELNLTNLAVVPPIVYGLLGLVLFVRMLALGESLIAGALTLSLLVLPIVVISSREALRAVPRSAREASFALGASRWQTVYHQVLPRALPGILTGTILALSRALGETAPLIMIGALAYVAFLPDSMFAPFSALPVQIFNWITRPQTGFHQNAAAAITLLLPVVLLLNSLAIWLRNRYERK